MCVCVLYVYTVCTVCVYHVYCMCVCVRILRSRREISEELQKGMVRKDSTVALRKLASCCCCCCCSDTSSINSCCNSSG